jgi:hypothetical protein
MNMKLWTRLMTVAVMVGTAAACEKGDVGVGPDGPDTFDAQAALADYAAVDAILGSAAWKSFEAMGRNASLAQVGSGPAFAVAGATQLRAVEDAADARDFAVAWVEVAGGINASIAGSPLISSEYRGTTFVFDDAADEYVPSERTGAPANGVRFILYETDASDRPIVENEIGHADLIDEGDASVEDIALRLLVVVDGTTVLDYATTLDESGANGRVTVDGHLTDGVDRLDFDIDVRGTGVPEDRRLDIDFEIRVDNRDFAILGSVLGMDNGSGESGAVDISVRHGPASLRVDLSGSDTAIDGTFFLNGEVFATVSGDPDNPTFEGADGGDLTFFEVGVLHEMVRVVEGVFGLFEDLVEPIGGLVLIAILL